MPRLAATLSPVRSLMSGTASTTRASVRSSGPRRATTMQNSDAPSRAVSSAAARSSSWPGSGGARTTEEKRADWLQNPQSSGQPPVLAEMIPSTSTVGPHQSRRTSWANAASGGRQSGGRAARAASSSPVSSRRSSSRAARAAARAWVVTAATVASRDYGAVVGRARRGAGMPFIQVIEYRTSRWDEMQELLTQYRKDTEGRRTAEKTTICVDRSAPGRFVAIVEFPSYEAA